jgi:RHH-type transcriptional regulator, rel operon repressor / antitoxin RelB
MDTATITARLDLQTKEKLENLAKATRRSRSFLVAEAVRAYVEDQAWQLKAIQEGLRQADAGEFAGEDEVKATFYKWGVDA